MATLLTHDSRLDSALLGAAHLGDPGKYAVAIVRVAAPWYAPDQFIASRFRGAVAEYEAQAALDRKLFTLSEDRHYGGIYLWHSREAAEAYHSPAWAEAIRHRRGSAPNVRLFNAPFVIEGPTALNASSLATRSLTTAALATVSLFQPPTTQAPHAALARLWALHGKAEGLVRTYLITGATAEIGAIDLWAREAPAQTLFSSTWIASASAILGTLKLERYRVPVLMNPAVK